MKLINLKKVNKILIIKLSAIGDVVHALPAANIIKRQAPWVELSWIVEDKAASILKSHPAIDKLIILPRQSWQLEFKGKKFTVLNEIIDFFKDLRSYKYDIAFDLQGLLKSGLVTYFSGATFRFGYSDAREGSRTFYNKKFTPPSVGTPVVERYLELIEKGLGIKGTGVEFRILSTQAEKEKNDLLFDRYDIDNQKKIAVIHPITSWKSKNWPLGSYSLLCDRLIEKNDCQVLFTGSDVDIEKIDLITKKMENKALNLAGKINLRELAELYKRADIFIGGDTGPMHIAAAVDCPVVVIMGPTDAERNGPYGENNVVIRNEELSCLNCWKRECPLGHNDCMKKLQPDIVLEAVRTIVEVN